MEFDKSKVYTALNADEVKIGSIGFVADNLYELENKVTSGLCIEDEILTIEDKYHPSRFVTSRFVENDDERISCNLFYLIQEPKEKKFRPYKDTNEMIEDFKKRFKPNVPSYGMPLIWLKDKKDASKHQITDFSSMSVTMNGERIDLITLFRTGIYTYLDGSPCGIEE